MSHDDLRSWSRFVTAAVAALAVICLAWELWLAPLRPGGSWLALKAVPLALALPGLARGRTASYRWWSMAILAYVCEGAVRALSDSGAGAVIAAVELALATLVFAGILRYMQLFRRAAQSTSEAARKNSSGSLADSSR